MVILKIQFIISILITQNIQFKYIKYEHIQHAHTHVRASINTNLYIIKGQNINNKSKKKVKYKNLTYRL